MKCLQEGAPLASVAEDATLSAPPPPPRSSGAATEENHEEVPQNVKTTRTSHDPAIPLLGMCPREMRSASQIGACIHVHRRVICSGRDVETSQVSVGRRMDLVLV